MTRFRVSALMRMSSMPLSTKETVDCDTPALTATSFIVMRPVCRLPSSAIAAQHITCAQLINIAKNISNRNRRFGRRPMVNAHRKRPSLGQVQAAWVLMLPFLAVYGLFLVYPFFRGIWISLHDWNLLAVAFNPEAKEFVGFRNYERVMWGRNIEWGLFAAPFWQGLGLIGLALSFALPMAGRLRRFNAVALGIASLLLVILLGFHPGEEGRWYDRRFWPTVGNTILFVGWTVPGVTISALVLAAAMNRETRTMDVLRTLFFLSQVLSVTVVTLIWQIMFSPRQGLIANITEVFGGTPINWLTDDQFAMAAIVIATIWWSLGIAMILFLAGLQDISKDIYEAAALDNARGAKAFWYVTL